MSTFIAGNNSSASQICKFDNQLVNSLSAIMRAIYESLSNPGLLPGSLGHEAN